MLRPFHYVPLGKLPFKHLPPNFITAANMILGLLAILFCVKGEFSTAAWLIVLTTFVDGLDGLLARLLKAQSHFGIEFDSFSDFVSFGIAPAALVLCYLQSGSFLTADISHIMWIPIIGAIFYVVMAALRLARFNVQTIELGDRLFHGIPTTACGGLVATFYLTLEKYGNPISDPTALVVLACATYVTFGLLMVSTIPLMKLRKRKNAVVTALQRGGTLLCFTLTLMRTMPDLLLFCGILYIVLGIRYGVKEERALRSKKAIKASEPKPAI